ncbi:MAG: HlyC/CorC family transporter [Flavobacteriales bacterium]|nr:HlyC/CorC family transporter [Flavobacteriales bacterium]MBK7942706.1 HlyC/CorC family transporter [Flavobacteriales bacterium]MBK8950766.1 HlyC/CorC family transporter [Flavobacteriales bacterium]MBK9698893.1 HlyC/CorC family transporter [Flavobacteriales bacterium]
MATADTILLVASLLVSALCSGLEIAFVTSNKLYIELQRKQGAWWAALVAPLLDRPARVIGALLVGNNIALVVFGLVTAQVLEPWLRGIHPNELFVLAAQTGLSTLVILILAEFLPKAVFRIDPNNSLALFALPLRTLYVLLWPIVMLLTGVSQGLLRLFGVKGQARRPTFGRVDLDEFLREMSADGPRPEQMDAEVEYFRNTLALSATKARDVMVPRAEIEAIEVEEPMGVLHQRFAESGLSKMLVYKDSIDNIIGYVHSYEMFRKPRTIRSVLRPVDFIPGTMPADEVLQKFTKQRAHVAVVVDEFGGTAGLLTIEDVVETIVGDIEDEHDSGEGVEERVGEHEFLFSARTEVERLVEAHRLALPQSEEYDTLAGLLLHHTGSLPEQGQVIDLGPFRFTVAQVVHSRIDLVRLLVTDPGRGYIP